MTTANADADNEDLQNELQDEDDQRTPTDHILEREQEEVEDSEDDVAAMMAGWGKAAPDTVKPPKDDDEAGDAGKQRADTGNDTLPGGDEDTVDGGSEDTPPGGNEGNDDPEIPGTGMRASEVRALKSQVDNLHKTLATANGHIGHLKQLVTRAGEGKKVTAADLKRVSEEFGPEFASAMADDLNTAGFGGGSSADPAAIQEMVSRQLEEGRVALQREMEKKLVTRAHPDAEDHFARQRLNEDGTPVMQKDKDGKDVPVWDAGPKHAAFMAFLQTLPAERQAELEKGGWDSNVITRALDDFKAHEKKVANTQTTQNRRIARAVVPRTGGGSEVQLPAEDPVMQGWNNVRGKRAAGPSSAGSRR